MSKVYNVYLNSVDASRIVFKTMHLKRWYGPIFDHNIQSVMLYTEKEAEEFIQIAKDNNCQIYSKIQEGVRDFRFEEVKYDKGTN